MKVNKQNKSTLITTFLILFTLAFIVFSFFLTAKVPSLALAGLLAIVEIFIVVPVLNIYYYKLWNVDLGVKRFLNFVPFYNYTLSMSKLFSILYFISLGMLSLVSLLIIFPDCFTYLPERIVFRASDYIPPIQFSLALLMNIFIGAGLLPVCFEIEKYYNKSFGNNSKGFFKFLTRVPLLTTAMLFVPILRVVPISIVCNQSFDLDKLNIHFKEEN